MVNQNKSFTETELSEEEATEQLEMQLQQVIKTRWYFIQGLKEIM